MTVVPNLGGGDIIADPDDVPGVPKLVKNYDVYRRTDVLKDTLSDLASLNTRRLSKKEQKAIRTNFADILDSVEYPTHGPRYQNAISQDTGQAVRQPYDGQDSQGGRNEDRQMVEVAQAAGLEASPAKWFRETLRSQSHRV